MPKIVVENISIEFPIVPPSSRSFRNVAVRAASRIGGNVSDNKGALQLVRALDNISFTLKDGDRLALLGGNGAGKTTLIRVLAGIYEPTHGVMKIQGTRVPMFDIGLGLDEEASGYENISVRGLILGLSPAQIRERIQDIADYSELGPYLKLPIRTYSSGMLLRLVFAIAVSLEGDIVLMDEWIAVGDASFRKKTHERLTDITTRSNIVVLASHDQNLLRSTCNLGLHLEGGRVIRFGAIDEVLDGWQNDQLAQEVVPVAH
ncbi:ABC transporter ATP-binding protein [Tardiphaga sp. 619_E2_N8_5]|uniref:ABC transporter ATP-binding protein n=1 Tax=unclassified Tardiphaga TaxID=2631404 RepID=UPI003F27866A